MALPTSQVTTVKKEKIDDHEINQLALEMAEKNRQKMISQAPQIQQQNQVSQQALQRAGGQQLITFYLQNNQSNKDYVTDSLLPKKDEEKKKGTLDEESLKGRFGWTTIHAIHIPYIYRHEEKFCSVKMVETKLLNKYLSYLPHEITTCIHVRSYHITEIESKLLNEINVKHCEYQFGREMFTVKDLVVKLSDAKCFYRFLDTCYKKLVQKSPEQSEYCGFVRINGESVVPYTVKATVKFVPLFYFEGETDTLKLKAQKIEGWELAYLKFCCKVQGIRNELFASDTCYVVSLDDVKQYFPKDTQFEDWWPQKTAEPMKVVSHGIKSAGNWTQRPSMPSNTNQSSNPPISSPAKSPAVPNVMNNSNSLKIPSRSTSINNMSNITNNFNLYSQWAASNIISGQAQAFQAQAAQAQMLANYNYSGMPGFMTQDHLRRLESNMSAANSNVLMQGIAANSSLGLRPPPLVRSANAAAQSYPSRRLSNNNLDALRQLGYLTDQTAANPMDALLAAGGHHPINPNAGVNNNGKSQSKAPPPLIPVSNGVRTESLSSHKGITRNGIDKNKLLDVPIFRPDIGRGLAPYKVSKVSIGGKITYSTNLVAFCYGGEHMIALQDIIKEFLPTATLSEGLNLFLEILKLEVYKANWHQVFALMEAWGSTSNTPDVVPLLKSDDLKDALPQIKYIYHSQQNMSQPQSKKIRT